MVPKRPSGPRTAAPWSGRWAPDGWDVGTVGWLELLNGWLEHPGFVQGKAIKKVGNFTKFYSMGI